MNITIKKIFNGYINFVSHVQFQIAFVTLFILCLILIFSTPLFKYHSTNAYPSIEHFVPQPQAIAQKQVIINTGLFIKDFIEFDIDNNNFLVDAIIWFEFNPSRISLDTLDNFSFEKGDIIYKSKPEIRFNKGSILAKYNIRLKFSTNLNHKFFPFNDHTIHIVLTNEFVSPSEMAYSCVESSFETSKNMHTSGWKLIGEKVESGYSTSKLDEIEKSLEVSYPIVVFSMPFEKPGLRKLLLILIPVFLLFLLAVFSMSIDPMIMPQAKLSLTTGALAGLLTYRFVIERVSPRVSYTTITDNIYTLILANTFLLFLFNIYLISQFRKKQKLSPIEQFIHRTFFILILLSTITILYVLVNKYSLVNK